MVEENNFPMISIYDAHSKSYKLQKVDKKDSLAVRLSFRKHVNHRNVSSDFGHLECRSDVICWLH